MKIGCRFRAGWIGLLAVGLLWSAGSWADSTQVLPRGRSLVSLDYVQDRIDRAFDSHGSNRPLGFQIDQQNITNLAEPLFNAKYLLPLAFDSLNLAMTSMDASVAVDMAIFSYQYGLSDDLTLGVGFPYFLRAQGDANFRTDLWTTAAAQGLGFPPGPVAMTRDAQHLLRDLFGFRRIENWSGEPGMGDLRVGLKYRFLNDENFKAAAGVWVTIPVGRTDNEKILTDIKYGNGYYDTGLYVMADFVPVKTFTLNFTGRYIINWPTHRGIYVLDESLPQFVKAEFPTLHRFGKLDPGDYYELETEGFLAVASGINIFAGFCYHQSVADTMEGDEVPITEVMFANLRAGASFNSLEAVMAKKPKLPFILTLFGERVLSGENTTLDNHLGLSVKIVF